MVIPHVQLDGTLAACAKPASCNLPYHLPELSEAEMRGYPLEMLHAMIEQLQQSKVDKDGWTFHYDDEGSFHRDYDLPALTWRDDQGLISQHWYQHGKIHRDGDKSAMIDRYDQEWYQGGKLHRGGGKPAVVGKFKEEWWSHGRRHRSGRKPAVQSLLTSGTDSYWFWNVKVPWSVASFAVKRGWLLPGDPIEPLE